MKIKYYEDVINHLYEYNKETDKFILKKDLGTDDESDTPL